MEGREYLLLFAQSHPDFRLPELHSVCELLDVAISYDEASVDLSASLSRQTILPP
jgi:tRNA G10  N-methylase Trm11